ncbi:DUF1016 N-terminal domain-containing protein [uncultured Parabacteroides sp.]|uniref:DUF1016 N-terminal domain-containing protein n=1 Tax=uncultured Parabacteroides sp. TaxID=512312 RepID=UPI00259BA01E|nr:DUF1016 N-terminal domain-containing protein [uncultured Parabacteroides sp.]
MKTEMKTEEDIFSNILFLIEKSQKEGSRKSNTDKNLLYREIGKLINQEVSDKVTILRRNDVERISPKLVKRYGEEFGVEQLLQMELVFDYFREDKQVSDLSEVLTWAHFLELCLIENKSHRDYYAEMCKKERWSLSVLRNEIRKLIV